MLEWLIQRLNDVPLASFMLVVALGFMIGRLSWRDMAIGPAGGTLGLALLLGAGGLTFTGLYGTETPPRLTIGLFGFVLFIYSVGFDAGPRFFAVLRGGHGWRFVAVGTLVNALALALTVTLCRAFSLGGAEAAGLLAGALTSPPTYAAASEMLLQQAPELEQLAVTFALTYPVGLVVVVLMVQFLPRLMGDDLAAEADAQPERADEERPTTPELTRAFDVVERGVVGRPLAELDLTHASGCYLTLVHRGIEVFVPDAQTVLELGDHVLAKGRLDELQVLGSLVGPEVYDEELRNRMPAPRVVAVASRAVVGRSLGELDLSRRFRVLVVGIRRDGVSIDPSSESVLERGDLLEVVGPRQAVGGIAGLMGREVQSMHQTDVAIYALGIFFGLVIGKLSVDVFEFPITLGYAGGLLIAGILMGRFRHLGPFDTHVPPSARQLVRDLGIMLFVAETGVRAGGSGFGAYSGTLVATLGIALVVTVVSVLVAVWFGRRMLKMSAVDTWGSVGGGMTSSSALAAIKRAAGESNAPALSYAAAYAVASVIVTLLGRFVIYLMM